MIERMIKYILRKETEIIIFILISNLFEEKSRVFLSHKFKPLNRYRRKRERLKNNFKID